jgi:hypothetical protein
MVSGCTRHAFTTVKAAALGAIEGSFVAGRAAETCRAIAGEGGLFWHAGSPVVAGRWRTGAGAGSLGIDVRRHVSGGRVFVAVAISTGLQAKRKDWEKTKYCEVFRQLHHKRRLTPGR